MNRLLWLLVSVGLCAVACKSSAKPEGGEATRLTAASVADEAETVRAAASAGWTRAEWLEAVAGFVAAPATIPRLADPAMRGAFARLVTTRAWFEHDGAAFAADPDSFLRFYSLSKELNAALLALGAADELVAFGLYSLEVFAAIQRSAGEFVAAMPAESASTRANRLAGLETMRRGAAISLCGLLYLLLDASADQQARAFAALRSPASYEAHSKEGLQLIVATLRDRFVGAAPEALRADYGRLLEVVTAAHAQRPADAATRQVVYEGLGPPRLDPAKLTSTTSTTGGFAVDLGPGALAKRVALREADGQIAVQHWIELQEGERRYEAICVDGKSEAELVAQFLALGLHEEPSALPGRWLVSATADRQARMRIVTLGGRGCVASVEGPGPGPGSGEATARAEAFLRSLRAAP